MELGVGAEVEALDQLGHWARGTVLKVNDETAVIKWSGWKDSFNKEVEWEDIRLRTPELTEVGRGKRRLPALKPVANIGKLIAGDPISYHLDGQICHGVVKTIDAFKNAITVRANNGQVLTVTDTDIVTETASCEPNQAKKRSRSMSDPKSSTIVKANDTQRESVQQDEDESRETFPEIHDTNQRQPDSRRPVFSAAVSNGGQLVECGRVYGISDANCQVQIRLLYGEPIKFSGNILSGEGQSVSQEIEINGPITFLKETRTTPLEKTPIFRRSKTKILSATLEAMDDIVDGERKSVRRQQLAVALHGEITSAKRGRSNRRLFKLGMQQHGVDSQILGMKQGTRRTFDVMNNTIQELDELLGERWDIYQEHPNVCRYVTHVTLVLSRVLTGVVKVARVNKADVLKMPDYRSEIRADISSAQAPGPANEDADAEQPVVDDDDAYLHGDNEDDQFSD